MLSILSQSNRLWMDLSGTDRCLLAAERGDNSCLTSERLSWYYDASTAACVQFVYAGCGGNDNRFETELDCRAACVGIYDSVPRGLGMSAVHRLSRLSKKLQ